MTTCSSTTSGVSVPRSNASCGRPRTGRMQRSTQAALQASEQRLRHAQRMEAVGLVARGIAHDFNNLFAVILGFGAFLIQELPQDRPGPPRCDQIRAASSAPPVHPAAARLQPPAGARAAGRRSGAPSANAADDPAADRRGPRFVQRPAAELVLIEPGQFEQVLVNLVVNAATPCRPADCADDRAANGSSGARSRSQSARRITSCCR